MALIQNQIDTLLSMEQRCTSKRPAADFMGYRDWVYDLAVGDQCFMTSGNHPQRVFSNGAYEPSQWQVVTIAEVSKTLLTVESVVDGSRTTICRSETHPGSPVGFAVYAQTTRYRLIFRQLLPMTPPWSEMHAAAVMHRDCCKAVRKFSDYLNSSQPADVISVGQHILRTGALDRRTPQPSLQKLAELAASNILNVETTDGETKDVPAGHVAEHAED